MHRREALVLGGVAALAGCLGSDDDDEEEEDELANGEDAIDVSFDGVEMDVSLETDADVDELVIVDDQGEALFEAAVSGGTATVELTTILDGTYTFELYEGGEEVAAPEMDFQADLTVIDVGRLGGAEVDLDEEPDIATGEQSEWWEPFYHLEAEIENTGTAPISVRPTRLYVDDPVPVSPLSFSHGGINPLDFPHRDAELLEPGESITLTTHATVARLPGPFTAEGEEREDLNVPENEQQETSLYVYDERGQRHETPIQVDYGELHLARPLSDLWTWLSLGIEFE